ncbi:hypothetical protein EG359_02455 [Chryseobacterium joostei]|uniref:Uncharacterized protein n=2 Tax=Chryseobacterium joostei TaxID=112234 RepID=A0A1N7ILR6_9FLAO|nr:MULTISPECIES: hypothetical protein [Chryseobacterium]AZA98534.1 hypothetical protein EG359_02455 [Chryseobacterium joostei]SIS37931.1 hypothetical protein SAMN05421768_10632 [Chryseobacterium joostei]HCM35928.1 hypothetical protein [Chryseobacterium sp.]
MKKIIFTGVLLAALGTTGVSANSLTATANANPKSEMSTQCFYYCTTYTTQKEGDCTVTYKHVTKYFLGIAICTKTTVCSKTCTGGGNTGGNL